MPSPSPPDQKFKTNKQQQQQQQQKKKQMKANNEFGSKVTKRDLTQQFSNKNCGQVQ